MSNAELKLLVVALFGLHAAVLALGLTRRGRPAVPWLVGADAALVLAWTAFHPRAFASPVDRPVVALAVFEMFVLVAAVTALRGVHVARAAVWLAFALHIIASGLAVAFAFMFRMTRLI